MHHDHGRDAWSLTGDRPRCPNCKSTLVPISYGLPDWTPELRNAVQKGEIVLGGCTISARSPRWSCRSC